MHHNKLYRAPLVRNQAIRVVCLLIRAEHAFIRVGRVVRLVERAFTHVAHITRHVERAFTHVVSVTRHVERAFHSCWTCCKTCWAWLKTCRPTLTQASTMVNWEVVSHGTHVICGKLRLRHARRCVKRGKIRLIPFFHKKRTELAIWYVISHFFRSSTQII